jgi:hypothetical protein
MCWVWKNYDLLEYILCTWWFNVFLNFDHINPSRESDENQLIKMLVSIIQNSGWDIVGKVIDER